MERVGVNGIELCYECIGEGEPLVLIMGLGMQMIAWEDDLCRMLASHGFRVIRFDNRDIGLSTKLDHLDVPSLPTVVARALLGLPVRAAYTLRDMAADTVGLLDALGIRSAHVMGVSMGGMIAQTMAILYPDRVRSLISAMSHPGNRRSMLVHPVVTYSFLRPLPRTPEGILERQIALLRLVSGPRFPFEEERLRDLAQRTNERSFHPPGVLRQAAAVGAAGSRVRALRQVRVPTLVLHGTHDPLVPRAGALATARAIPGARLRWIEGMGHDLPRLAWPELVEAVVAHARRRAGPHEEPA